MNTSAPLHVVILAAGQGTRMKSTLPKVLHPVGGRPMLAHVLDTARELNAAAVHVVHGYGAEKVRQWFDAEYPSPEALRWVLQADQFGTAHAVQQAMPNIPDDATVLVLYGDVPLIRAETLVPAVSAGGKGLALVTTHLPDPRGYGRILRNKSGAVQGIVEEADATATQKKIGEINTGFLAAPARLLRGWLDRVKSDNAKGEFYLTDIVAMAVRRKLRVETVEAPVEETLGANDRLQLAQVERVFQHRQAQQLLLRGVTIADPHRFELRGTFEFGTDCSLDIGVILEGEVVLGSRVSIGPYCLLRDVKLGDGTRVEAHSVLDSVEAGRNCRIGPFARLRPDTRLDDEVHIGNFVEVKRTRIGRGSKANHLAYLGDGQVGSGVNVGAGTIFCNYDGVNKHQTVIEDEAFIGSDTQLVAPVRVGKGATVGAGSIITKDVPPGGLTLSRAKEQKSYSSWKRPQKKK
jgi:bifunctional UDP-N-acetylglucosamine pyrophosphorylase / glucosamine-1-phosphate N-acetyltransferase